MKYNLNFPVEVEIDDEKFTKALEQAVMAHPDFMLVTRCKDCKYFEKNAVGSRGVCNCGCIATNVGGEIYPDEDDFCNYGERAVNG